VKIETGKREQRAVTLDSVEFRAADDGSLKFRGHAAVFDEWTEIASYGGSFQESIARGSFRKVLADGADVRFLINHDGLPLARTAAGTMTLKEDTKGLRVDADLAPTTLAKDLAVLLERRDISQMSFGFRVGKHEVVVDEENDVVKRTITEFSELYDVSPVTFPAYEGTDAALRAALQGAMTDAHREALEALAAEISGRNVAFGLKAEDEKPQMGRSTAWCRIDLLEMEAA
jgi:HK97 family phage prohead protease